MNLDSLIRAIAIWCRTYWRYVHIIPAGAFCRPRPTAAAAAAAAPLLSGKNRRHVTGVARKSTEAWFRSSPKLNFFHSLRHIKFLDVCMEH
jgi:hypothetical protein